MTEASDFETRCCFVSLRRRSPVGGWTAKSTAFQKEAELMKERSEKLKSTPHPGPLPDRGGEGGKKVCALIPLNLDGFLFSADYQSGKKAEITSRVAANFVGWQKDQGLFDRELG